MPTDEHANDDHADHDHQHTPMAYADAIRDFRTRKDEFFRSGAGSPLPADARADFPGIPYFEVDESLVFDELVLEPYAGDEPVNFEIPTSDGRQRATTRAGVLRFDIDGAPFALTAYTFEGGHPGSVFVPFLDRTSGTETYGAGRYLDLEAYDDGTFELDFNLAYHPSCVYDTRFSCPLTPGENRLSVRIEAGERLADGH